ncbi:hypothetical protein EDD17DRAFT_1059749 [Pisolithus thermaeus]|nr:hypothetical protein EDD17DRAFT_1059749 [Pisolithus thermaeus]
MTHSVVGLLMRSQSLHVYISCVSLCVQGLARGAVAFPIVGSIERSLLGLTTEQHVERHSHHHFIYTCGELLIHALALFRLRNSRSGCTEAMLSIETFGITDTREVPSH